MKIGEFKADEDGGYTGQLDALGLTVSCMTFSPVQEKRADGPDFIITGYGEWDNVNDIDYLLQFEPGQPIPNPNSYEVGAAWKKVSQNGKPYLSVKLDGPTLAAPIDCRLIERKDGSFSLIWKRKEEQAPATVEHQTAA
jgi:uncharacterized protein (DUF736 family)